MHFFNFGIVVLWGVGGIAYDLTIYNNVNGCDAKDDTQYRIISGISDREDGMLGTCQTFDRDMPNTDCVQFDKGGWENGPCTSGSLLPKSALVNNDLKACFFYGEPDCNGVGRAQHEYCITASEASNGMWENFKSFRCDWDGSVDILANVGCKNGVSTNICTNDCECRCNAQNLDCPKGTEDDPIPVGCNHWALQNCVQNCVCVNP